MKILFRKSLAEEDEFEVAKKHFEVIENRALIQKGDLILCRYSSLPYHKELENDVKILGASLVNSYEQHRYVADMSNWYSSIKEYTPRTWFSMFDYRQSGFEGPVVLKGETNSRKQLWKTHMYAGSVEQAVEVWNRLMDDSLLSHQNICVREFESFVNYGYGINGAPITKEFRVFVFDGQIMGGGFYWAGTHPEVIDEHNPQIEPEGFELLKQVINIVGRNIRFLVIDIAQRKDGVWRVVELNDGCMSGLSAVNPDELYRNLKCVSG